MFVLVLRLMARACVFLANIFEIFTFSTGRQRDPSVAACVEIRDSTWIVFTVLYMIKWLEAWDKFTSVTVLDLVVVVTVRSIVSIGPQN